MKNLMLKEFKLAASPLTYFFIAGAGFCMLPNYPILIGAFFVCLGIFYSFQNAREANDVIYTVLLPVKKTDHVRAKYCFTLIIQGAAFIVMCALTLIRMTLLAGAPAYVGNSLMNATPLFLAFALLIFAAFNTVFIGMHFRTGWKIGVPFIVFAVTAFLLVSVGESLHFIPSLGFFNVPSGENLPLQFGILGAAAVVFAVSTFISCRRSMKNFERTDL